MCFVQILNNKHKILYFLWLHQLHTENYAIGHILSWMSRQTTILVPLLESLCWLINGAANNRSLVCLVTIVPSSWHAKKKDDHHWGCFTSLIWLTTKDRSNNLHKATTYVYAKIVAKSVPVIFMSTTKDLNMEDIDVNQQHKQMLFVVMVH